ncbi:MAG: serine hydrolase [Candidatus Acidiferrales bacterium]
MNTLKWILTIVVLSAFPSAVAQNVPRVSPSVEQHIQHVEKGLIDGVIIRGEAHATYNLADRMKALHVPGVSIAVVHDGKIEWARGFGVARIGGPPVDANTMFQAGSISKPLATMAALELVEQDKLTLDTDINKYLASWKLPAAPVTDGKPVTLRELLTHTAGINVHGFPGYASNRPVPTLVQVLNGGRSANTPAIRSEALPGGQWKYSGGGYIILQQAAIDVTHEPFARLLHDSVLTPIGMTHSTFEQPLPKDFRRFAATPYGGDGKPVEGGAHTYPELAAAGLWTTPTDLCRYIIEVQRSFVGKANHVLSAEMTNEMLTPGMGSWGLGLGIGGAASNRYFSHGGANAGFRNVLVGFEKNGEGAVVMTNGDNGGPITEEVMHSIAVEYNWPGYRPVEHTVVHLNRTVLAQYVGTCQLQPNDDIVVILKSGQLTVHPTGEPDLPIYPESNTRFFSLQSIDIEFVKDDRGKVTALILYLNGGRGMRAPKK